MFGSVSILPTAEQIVIMMEYKRKRQQDEGSARRLEASARRVYPRMNPPGALSYPRATERAVVQHSAPLRGEDSIPTEQPVEEATTDRPPAHYIIA
jgi:hypothetical protein